MYHARMSKTDSGSSGLGASRPIAPSRSAAQAGGFNASGGASKPVSDLAGKLAETTKPVGRVYKVGRFTITNVGKANIGRNPGRGNLFKITDGKETAHSYTLADAKVQAQRMIDTPKSQRDAESDALAAKIMRNK